MMKFQEEESANNVAFSKFRTGFATIIGRPSVGKSTFINTINGHNTTITSPYPQTTRNIIKGIVTKPQYQIIFLDTPGVHISEKRFSRHLTRQVTQALQDADVILYMLDAQRPPQQEEQEIITLLQPCTQPIIVAINKMDKEKPDTVQAHLDLLRTHLQDSIHACHFISALQSINLYPLLTDIAQLLPIQSPLYPEDYYTDQSVDFRICEQVRGAALEFVKEELPYALYTEILESAVKHKNKNGEPTHIFVRVQIIVEQESQKGILIGKHGSMIKAIRIASMKRIRPLFPYNVQLELKVAVRKNWRTNPTQLSKLQ